MPNAVLPWAPLATVDVATLVTSAAISAGVAGTITILTNVLMGGPIDVLRQRAVRRDARIGRIQDILRAAALAANGIQGTLDPNQDTGLAPSYSERYDAYQAAFIAAMLDITKETGGFPVDSFEAELGQASYRASDAVGRVHFFREATYRTDPASFQAHMGAMRNDLSNAIYLLQVASHVADVRWLPSRRGRHHLRRAVRLFPQFIQTPERRGTVAPAPWDLPDFGGPVARRDDDI